ncbi:MAG: Spy/CpxP family protein refolding chaperone [Desulfurella sp.]|uniref:Spy/CpxP family protein refolding chaperone n=1 Tax=Desulfurella sp. TaxID=1962857 RepID=UPI003C9C5719
MKKTFVSALLAATLFSSGVSLAIAGPMGGGFNTGFCGNAGYGYHARGNFGYQYMQKELNLTPAQVQQLEQLRKEVFQNSATNQSNYKMPMFDSMKSGNFNKQVFIEESEQNAKLRAQNRANYMEHFFSILTPVQRQKFVQLQKEKMQFALKNMENRQQMLQNRINYLKSNVQ